ncbi:hypothetical protein TIFTF001_035293 [Ficus carica]|uniref:Uncharacterized protein n=1 Tax=Ficus carica TaxID=3494 RepID=A0AA88EA53_FICCA|nr:hypothetical protein TIFTF001_035293 [Ficus carica]
MPLTSARSVRPTVGDARNRGATRGSHRQISRVARECCYCGRKKSRSRGATSDITTLSLPKSPLKYSTVFPLCDVDGNLLLLASSL